MVLLPLGTACCQSIEKPISQLDPKEVSQYIRVVFQDQKGDYWFGTNDDGVARYDGTVLRFYSIREGLAGRAVRGIQQDTEGALWFATDGGVSRYRHGQLESFTIQHGLSDNDTWSLARDLNGVIWVGTRKGPCFWNGSSFVPLPFPTTKIENPVSRFAPNLIWCIEVDRDGNVWFGTDGIGVYRYDGKSFDSFRQDDGLVSNQVMSIVQDHLGVLWFGSMSGGVGSYDGKQFRRYGRSQGLPEGILWRVYESPDGKLMFSVLGAGLFQFVNERFEESRINQLGLPKHVQSLLNDREGKLWLGCSGGLFRVDGEKLIHVTTEGPWPTFPFGNRASSNPLEHFSRFTARSWTVTAATGKEMHHTWKWGPGKFSIERWTEGESARGEPWKELIVYYWHPIKKQIHLLGMSPYASGIQRGTIDFDGKTGTAIISLAQTSGLRKMKTQWKFDDEDRYRETLLETDSSGKEFELVSFVHHRSKETHDPASQDPASSIPVEWEGFRSLLGKEWIGRFEGAQAPSIQTSFQWIPKANFLYGMVQNEPSRGGNIHIYLYRDTETKSLRCLALQADSSVFDGEIRPINLGNVQADMRSFSQRTSASFQSSWEILSENHIQQTIRSNEVSPPGVTLHHER